MAQITPELIEAVESKIRKEIKHEQEKASCLRKLEALKGKYVTKRLEPDLKAMFPDYKYVSLHKDQYSGKIEIILNNPGGDYWYDAYHLSIADKDRRIDSDRIKKQIEDAEKTIANLEGLHANFRNQAMQLANLIPYMQSIAAQMYQALSIADRKDNDYSIRHLKEICNQLRWS